MPKCDATEQLGAGTVHTVAATTYLDHFGIEMGRQASWGGVHLKGSPARLAKDRQCDAMRSPDERILRKRLP